MTKVTVIGNSMVDVIFQLPKIYLHKYLQKEQIELPFGEKLATDNYVLTIGGSGANVAVGLQRAGLPVSFYTSLSKDHFGQYIGTELEKEGIDLHASRTAESTSLSVILRVAHERTIITAHSGPTPKPEQPLPKSGWIHLGPLHGEVKDLCQLVLNHQLQTGQPLSINPSQEMVEERERTLLALLRNTSILFVNHHEGVTLARLPRTAQVNEIIDSVHRMGPKIVCLTAAEKGAYVSLGKERFHAAALMERFDRVDATGAGDAFTSGFLAAYIPFYQDTEDEESLIHKALAYAMVNSGSVVATVGAEAGLLPEAKLAKDAPFVKIKSLEA